jgi:hypothetical protein
LVTIHFIVISYNSEKGDGDGGGESLDRPGKIYPVRLLTEAGFNVILGAFRMYAKSACNFVMSACRACTRAATTGRIFLKFHIVCFYENP